MRAYARRAMTTRARGQRLNRCASRLVLFVFVCGQAGSAGGEPLDAGPADGAASSGRELLSLAGQVDALMAGTLDPAIEPRDLFRVDLTSSTSDVAITPSFLEGIDVAGEGKPLSYPAGTSDDVRALWDARRAFFALPEEERAALLAAHAERQRAASERQARLSADRAELEAVTARAAQLRAFVAGELDLDVQPLELLAFDLLDDEGIARSSVRRRAVLGVARADEPIVEPPAEIDGQLRDAYNELDRALAEYLALSESARAALFDAYAERVRARDEAARARASAETEAEEQARLAAEQHDRALAAARDAATEAERIVADERARLLGIRSAQSLFEVELEESRQVAAESRDRALRWSRRVSELAAAGDRRTADAAYDELVVVLTEERGKLSDALDQLAGGASRAPAARSSDAQPIPDHVDSSSLDDLRAEVRDEAARLQRLEADTRWETATALRDGVVALNTDRLRLMSVLTSRRRGELQGFGPEGIAQARRELSQIALELRYHVHAAPRIATRLRREVSARPLATVIVVLELLLVLFAFRAWRRRSGPFLAARRTTWLAHRPQTKPRLVAAALIWYAQRVRAPLEWLALFWALGYLTPDVDELPELSLVWIVTVWVLLGTFAVRVVDALAARQPALAGSDTTARLRYRSLRLIGFTIIAVGLSLSIAEELVGKGAIYTWVWRTCWLLAIPVVLWLLLRWRPVIFERAGAHPAPSFALRWTLRNQRGIGSFPATAVGGVVLLVQGVGRYVLRQASHLAVTRRFLAHLFRREVEKHAAARADDADYQPLPDDYHSALDPGAPSGVLVTSVAAASVAQVATVIRKDNNALVAVVGERGQGKTRFMERAMEGLSEDVRLSVTCAPGGFATLLRRMAVALDLPAGCDERAVIDALQAKRPIVICVDDAQRLVRPLIGGLADIDHLVRFAHEVGPTTSWLIAIDAPAWQYLRRARGDRAVFDDVVSLGAWDEDQIRELIIARAKEAGFAPRFDELVVPRQVLDAQYGEAERTERDYCRILWDHADGNPTVALFFWRESLALRDDAVYVRLFQSPSIVGLEGMPGSLHFVLRAVVQLELANVQDIIRCTGLLAADVVDAMRVARTHGYIEAVDGYQRIALPYFRTVIQFLRRQHLLVA